MICKNWYRHKVLFKRQKNLKNLKYDSQVPILKNSQNQSSNKFIILIETYKWAYLMNHSAAVYNTGDIYILNISPKIITISCFFYEYIL